MHVGHSCSLDKFFFQQYDEFEHGSHDIGQGFEPIEPFDPQYTIRRPFVRAMPDAEHIEMPVQFNLADRHLRHQVIQAVSRPPVSRMRAMC